MTNFADHFSSIALRYAQYRPHYPQALADALADLCTRHDAAWDAGAGNGQLSLLLAKRFAHVYAHDPSQAQLDAAIPLPNVEYRCAKADDSGLPDASVDLAVAAQAAHWFDWPKYVAEVQRVARPGALVGLVSYGILHVAGDADAIVAHYYHDVVGAYWPKGREHVENGYRDLTWPWPSVAAPQIEMDVSWTRDELIGYVATWSATNKLVEKVGSGPYDALAEELRRVWPDRERRRVSWPLAIKLARR